MVWRSLAVVAFTVLVPISLRGAIEHSSEPGDPGFANEYTTFFPIFNINRHIHHHEDPTVPWYLLEWRTDSPLPAFSYITHWFRIYITRELVPMQPMAKGREGIAGKPQPDRYAPMYAPHPPAETLGTGPH
jgi:hypothetical protein